jgi:hypothetical protein
MVVLLVSRGAGQAGAAPAEAGVTEAGLPAEGTLEPFRGEPRFDMQQVFSGNRFPNVVVATDGTVLAFWNGVKVRRSEDGGKSWPLKRLVTAGGFGYSSLNAGRPGTPSEGWIYLQFEGGPKGGATMARFNLAWLLQGEKTGDGQVPQWLMKTIR